MKHHGHRSPDFIFFLSRAVLAVMTRILLFKSYFFFTVDFFHFALFVHIFREQCGKPASARAAYGCLIAVGRGNYDNDCIFSGDGFFLLLS